VYDDAVFQAKYLKNDKKGKELVREQQDRLATVDYVQANENTLVTASAGATEILPVQSSLTYSAPVAAKTEVTSNAAVVKTVKAEKAQVKAEKKEVKKAVKEAKKAAKGGKSQLVALLLVILVGGLGIHRFYLGYTTIGIIQLLTLGGCGVWALIDLIRIAIGDLGPKDGDYTDTI
jgi:TM2 domain-containing membrane protein YozV